MVTHAFLSVDKVSDRKLKNGPAFPGEDGNPLTIVVESVIRFPLVCVVLVESMTVCVCVCVCLCVCVWGLSELNYIYLNKMKDRIRGRRDILRRTVGCVCVVK